MSVESFETVPETAEPPVDRERLTFADACVYDWQHAVERVDNGRHLLEDVGKLIRGIERLELDYAAKLRNLTQQLRVPKTESSSVRNAIEALKNELNKRAHHSDEFASALRSDVVMQTVENTAANHARVFRQARTDGTTVNSALRDAESNHLKSLKALDEAGKKGVMAAIEAQGADSAVAQQRTRLHMAALKAAVDAQIAEQRYHNSVTHLNTVRNNHVKRMQSLLETLENMDRKRLECLRDSLVKTYVYRTAQSRNNEYDTNHCIETLQQISPAEDHQEYLRAFGRGGALTTVAPLPWTEVEQAVANRAEDSSRPSTTSTDTAGSALRNFLRQTPFENVVQTASAQLRDLGANLAMSEAQAAGLEASSRGSSAGERLPPLKDLVERAKGLGSFSQTPYIVELEKGCRTILAAIWDGDFVKARELCGKSGLNVITDELSHSLNRLVLCHALHTQTQIKGWELANSDSFHAMAIIFKEALDYSDAHNDFWTGRFLMLISQRLFARGVGLDDDLQWRFPETEEQARAITTCTKPRSEGPEPDEAITEAVKEGVDTPVVDVAPREQATSIDEKEVDPLPMANTKLKDASIRRLHQGTLLYEHPLWNRVHFWEEAFLLTISEDLQQQMLRKAYAAVGGGEEELDDLEKMFKKRNPCWPALCVFAFSMASYGIQALQVKGMVATLCSRYGLNQEYVNRLTECIKTGNSPQVNLIQPASEPALLPPQRRPQSEVPN